MEYKNQKIEHFWRDWFLVNMAGASILLNIAIWVWSFLKIPKDVDIITLHYSAVFGVNLVDAPSKIYYLPGIGLALLACNFFLSWLFYTREPVASRILAGVALIVQVVLLVSVILILKFQ